MVGAVNKPLISIITVCLNNLKELKQTLSSVFIQDFHNYELIVIDGCSTDGTQEYLSHLESKGSRIRYISEKDQGIYDAMNKGIRLAHGSYTIFLNGGDLFASEKTLSHVAQSLSSGNAPDLIYGDSIIEYPNSKNYQKTASPLVEIYKGMPFVHQSMLISTNWLKSHPFELRYKIAADYDLVCKAFAEGLKFKHVDATIARYQTGGLSDIKRLHTISEFKEIALRYLPNKFRTKCYYILRGNYERFAINIKKLLPKNVSLWLAHLKSQKLNAMRSIK